MNIRVIAGEYGGRRLVTPPGKRTHPMGERVRGAMFNSLHDEIRGATVLDAFAGSGAIGIEALSRGAASAMFIEADRVASNIAKENIESLGLDDQAKLVRARVGSWISTYAGEPFDIIFADPPYHEPQLQTIYRLFSLLKPGALMVLSHPGIGEVPFPNNLGIVVVDNRSYANAHLTYFRRAGQ